MSSNSLGFGKRTNSEDEQIRGENRRTGRRERRQGKGRIKEVKSKDEKKK